MKFRKKPRCLYFSNALICVSESIGLVKSWKEIYVNSLQNVFTETRLEDVDLPKTHLCKPRVSELRKQQYTVTRLQSFYHAVVLLLCFILNLRAISKYKPPEAYIWRGDLTGGSLTLRAWGAYIWTGLYMEGHIFGILRFLWRNQTSSQVHFNFSPVG